MTAPPNADDVVRRLRERGPHGSLFCECGEEAATLIETLRAEKAALIHDNARYVETSATLATEAAQARREALEEAWDCQPVTAADPNESFYDRAYFDGVMAFGNAIAALIAKDPAK